MDLANKTLISARQRPRGRPILTQKWESLFFFHWKYDSNEIQKRLPAGLYVDTFKGDAFLSIIGFRMSKIRLLGLPAVPMLSSLNELNVRTYVRTADGKPGVYFFSLDCDHWLAVKIAQLSFNLNYKHAKIDFSTKENRLSCLRSNESVKANFAWESEGVPAIATPGGLDFFLLERYLFFTKRGNQILMGQVYHPPYVFTSAVVHEYSEAPFLWNQLLPTQNKPFLVHTCRDIAIEAFPLTHA